MPFIASLGLLGLLQRVVLLERFLLALSCIPLLYRYPVGELHATLSSGGDWHLRSTVCCEFSLGDDDRVVAPPGAAHGGSNLHSSVVWVSRWYITCYFVS